LHDTQGIVQKKEGKKTELSVSALRVEATDIFLKSFVNDFEHLSKLMRSVAQG